MYDAIFKLTLPEGATVVGFADDVAVVVSAKYWEEVILIANQAVATVRGWLSSVGLQLADHKTEVLLVTSRKQTESITVSKEAGTIDACTSPEKEERKITTDQWRQQRWETADSGRWTHRLIPYVGKWYDRQHGEVEFYITQLLTGHGCFIAYQYRFKLDYTAECPECQTVEKIAEHVFFTCIRFPAEISELERVCGGRITPENVVSYMLLSDQHWNAVKRFTTVVLKRLREEVLEDVTSMEK
ncbi:uncharacterized protein [Halyomorpha halys]|uniref:uncharacterized protein n=1 Tax=Halyomorpha halys TaxID=286706 RepID=UPI0034D2D10D